METARISHITFDFIVIIDRLGYLKHRPMELMSERLFVRAEDIRRCGRYCFISQLENVI
jgi:hypothetical protein